MGVSRWGGPRRTRRTPRPSSPWQPDQFANRRQPRLTYRVFLGLFFSYLPLPSFSPTPATVLCVSALFPSSRPFFFSWFRLLTRVYTYVKRDVRERGAAEPHFPSRFLPSIRSPLALSLCLFDCTFFCTRSRKRTQAHREMGATLILPTTDTTPSARLIRTWRL